MKFIKWITGLITLLLIAGCNQSTATSQTQPPENRRIACVGDSITEGYGLHNPATQSYPARLTDMLPSAVIGNFGKAGATLLLSGDRPYMQTARFEASKTFAPTVVIIALGTNDAKEHNWIHHDTFIQDYLNLIATYRRLPSKPTVYIALPPPVFHPTQGISDRRIRNEVIPLIRHVAAQSGVPLIDFYTPLQDRGDLFNDGIHPNPAGAALLAETVKRQILP